jgi:hypothetical protein
MQQRGISNQTKQEQNVRLTLLLAFIAEQRLVEDRIINQYQVAQAVYQACKKKLDNLKLAREI